MNPQDIKIQELEMKLKRLEEIMYTHKHRGYDFTETLASTSTSPGGSDTYVQYNDGGSFGGSAQLSWDNATKTLTVGGDGTTGIIKGYDESGDLSVRAGNGLTGNNSGGDLILRGGDKSGTGRLGNVKIAESSLSTSANGGFLILPTCAGTPTGTPSTGACIYDTTNDKLYVYRSGWKSVTLA